MKNFKIILNGKGVSHSFTYSSGVAEAPQPRQESHKNTSTTDANVSRTPLEGRDEQA